jgi:hypothetical protein
MSALLPTCHSNAHTPCSTIIPAVPSGMHTAKQYCSCSRLYTSSACAAFSACFVSCVCWTSTAGVHGVLQQHAGSPTSQLQLTSLPRLSWVATQQLFSWAWEPTQQLYDAFSSL